MSKDWTGNGKSTFVTLGASNHTDKKREANDFYATDPKAIDALVGYMGESIPCNVWECACGAGHLSERLKHFGYNVFSSDLIDREYGYVKDFLLADRMPDGCECIITNPPYKYATEFVLHALDVLPVGGICAMFLKTTFLEGKKRHDCLFRDTPPLYVLQFVRRVMCAKNGDFQSMVNSGGSAASYAWFVWEKGSKCETTVKWV